MEPNYLRLDDDIQFHRLASADFFADMIDNKIRVGWVQHIPDNGDALASTLFSDVQAYVASDAHKNFEMSDIWSQVSIRTNRGMNGVNDWRPYLTAGKIDA